MRRIQIVAVLAGVLGVFASTTTARAHFVLQAPASWSQQSNLGDPQKSAPCGQADPGLAAVPTDVVTTFSPGQTITVTINETITHPGHYRVVLSANGQSGLPPDPPVTPASGDPCDSTVIQSPPVFPVLADGELAHTSAFSGPQSFQVTLPSDVTCTNCVLQVAQYMRNHALNDPGGCFYHHCANISIQAATGDGGAGDATDGGTTLPADDSGCGCAIGRAGTPPAALGLVTVLVFLASRRSRPCRPARSRSRRPSACA